MSGLDDLLKSATGGQGAGALGGLLNELTHGSGTSTSPGAGGAAGAGSAALMKMLLPLVAGLLANGGLQKILAQLHTAGLSSQADSWVGKGANQSISADQLKKALGDGPIADIAQKLGVSHDQAASALAEVLPHVVDHVTPTGSVPAAPSLESALGQVASALEHH